MRQSFRDLTKEDWQKKKLYYEALIRTDSYRRLVDEAITRWAKAKNKAFVEWAKAENKDLNRCKLAISREQFFSEPNLEASLLATELNIDYLFDPDKELPEVAVSRTAIQSIRRQAAKFIVKEVPPDPGPKLRPFGSKISPPSKREFVPLEPFKKDGRYLLIEIDLNASKKKILAEIEFTINIHKLTIKKENPKRGISPLSKISPFKVYDLAESGKNLNQIMWELFPEVNGRNPNYDENAKKHYEEIRRLHSKAKGLIKEAENSIPQTLKRRLLRNSNVEKKNAGPT